IFFRHNSCFYIHSKYKVLESEDMYMKFLMLVGRVLFAQIFILSSFGHFKTETIKNLGSKVPYAEFLIPLSGAMALVGGISILLGYKAKIGGLLIGLFLIPFTVMMQDLWYAPPDMV